MISSSYHTIQKGRPSDLDKSSSAKLHPEFKEALRKQGQELQAERQKLHDRLAKENAHIKELTSTHGEYHTPRAAAYRESRNRVEDELNSFYNQLEDFSTKTGIAKDF